MIKITYEKAINDVENLHKCLGDKTSRDISAKNILQTLEQAQKQEKLLDLYKEHFRLSNIPIIDLNNMIYVFNRLQEIKNEIKELENDRTFTQS